MLQDVWGVSFDSHGTTFPSSQEYNTISEKYTLPQNGFVNVKL